MQTFDVNGELCKLGLLLSLQKNNICIKCIWYTYTFTYTNTYTHTNTYTYTYTYTNTNTHTYTYTNTNSYTYTYIYTYTNTYTNTYTYTYVFPSSKKWRSEFSRGLELHGDQSQLHDFDRVHHRCRWGSHGWDGWDMKGLFHGKS